MPTLKQLTCNVEWAGSRLPLQEHHTIYADGYVETFIAIPLIPSPFSIHLRSHGYIAPGLAMFVYASGFKLVSIPKHTNSFISRWMAFISATAIVTIWRSPTEIARERRVKLTSLYVRRKNFYGMALSRGRSGDSRR